MMSNDTLSTDSDSFVDPSGTMDFSIKVVTGNEDHGRLNLDC